MPFGRIQGGREIFICLFIRIVTDELLATAFVANNLSDQTTILAIKSHLARCDICNFLSAHIRQILASRTCNSRTSEGKFEICTSKQIFWQQMFNTQAA